MSDRPKQHATACTPEQIARRGNRKPVNLALQGGGAHGAFGWGVLDKLLEDDRLAVDAISATSAGAMNAAVMAWGVSQGGRDGARAKLEEFWQEISRAGQIWSPVRTTPWEQWLAINHIGLDASPSYRMFQTLTHVFSPYQLNPFDFNPLRDVLTKIVDFDRLRACPTATRLFLCATNVRNGKIKVFENADLSADVVMASACLPYIFKAVEIDGEHYWDGGYMGNPAIFPLIYKGASNDVIVVHINPIVRPDLPTTAPDIFNRMNEISFNSSLMREMRAIAFVTRLIDDKALDERRYNRMLVHSIRNDAEMAHHGVASKLSPDWHFLCHLRDVGRQTAAQWLAENFESVGVRSTVDVGGTYL
ncbi:MAG: patatin-like phospholipase family protein [Hyphomicrobiaceae bacterium]